jgi:hypothetical protein
MGNEVQVRKTVSVLQNNTMMLLFIIVLLWSDPKMLPLFSGFKYKLRGSVMGTDVSLE